MSNRDDFEAAYVTEIAAETMAWYLRDHRDGEHYRFESDILTGMLNAAWWAWRRGQASVLANAPASEVPHVLH